MNILSEDIKVEVGREDTLKLIIGNDSLYETSNINGARAINFATSKNLAVIRTMSLHQKHTWTSLDLLKGQNVTVNTT
jgi:hypothetical protein